MDREVIVELLMDAAICLGVDAEILEIEGWGGTVDIAIQVRADLYNISRTYRALPKADFHVT